MELRHQKWRQLIVRILRSYETFKTAASLWEQPVPRLNGPLLFLESVCGKRLGEGI